MAEKERELNEALQMIEAQRIDEETRKEEEENKHCEILVSCSDKEKNCIQTHGIVCKLIVLHASSWYFM